MMKLIKLLFPKVYTSIFNEGYAKGQLDYSEHGPINDYQYDKNKILIAVYDSIQNAVKATGYNKTTIRRNIQNISSSKLFIWTDKPLY